MIFLHVAARQMAGKRMFVMLRGRGYGIIKYLGPMQWEGEDGSILIVVV